MPEALAGLAASAAIAITDIPFNRQCLEVRVVRIDENFLSTQVSKILKSRFRYYGRCYQRFLS